MRLALPCLLRRFFRFFLEATHRLRRLVRFRRPRLWEENCARVCLPRFSKHWIKSGARLRRKSFILCFSGSVEQLAGAFERMFSQFRDYYASTVLILWGFLREDPQRFSALTVRSFQESEHLVRAHGPQWIGQEASLNALQALATVTRIAKAATLLFDKESAAHLNLNESDAGAWANAIVAYVMAFSAVLASLTALASGRTTEAKLENVAALAHWSKRFAVQAYHSTKAIGLLKTVRPGAPIGRSEEEDLILAEAGLDSYAEALPQDDQPSIRRNAANFGW
jgi:hypothetical protein